MAIGETMNAEELQFQNQQAGRFHVIFLIGAILTLIALLVHPASAYTTTNMSISPAKDIVAGDLTSTVFTFQPEPWYSSDYQRYSANPNDTIQITTALDNPTWTRDTVLDGAHSWQTISSINTLTLKGWDLAYRMPGSDAFGEMINITLTGTAPNVTSSSSVIFVNIAEYDQTGQKIASSDQTVRQTVIDRQDLPSVLYLAQRDLDKFNADITREDAAGIDVSAEKTMYSSASTNMGIARQMPPAQYEDAIKQLSDVNTEVAAGEQGLQIAWATHDINHASDQISRLDTVIEWFRTNSTPNYPGLKAIIGQQNNASALVGDGTTAMDNGDYAAARIDAANAFEIANRTLPDALALQKKARDPLTIIWDNEIIVLACIALCGLYLLFRPKKKKVKKTE